MESLNLLRATALISSTWGALLASLRAKRKEWKADYPNTTAGHLHQGIYLTEANPQASPQAWHNQNGCLDITEEPSHEIGDFELTKKSFESRLRWIIARILQESPEFHGELRVSIEGNGYLYDNPSQLADPYQSGDLADYWDLIDVARIIIPPASARVDSHAIIEFSV